MSRRRPWADGATDLPVLLPPAERLANNATVERRLGAPRLRLRAWHGAVLAVVFVVAGTAAAAQQSTPQPDTFWQALIRWAPLLLQAFIFNIAISVLSMTGGTVAGVGLGLMQIATFAPTRALGWAVTQFFRNSPWLVLLFYCMLLMPFQFRIMGATVPFPDWMKATFGLALPVMANVSEIVRGAVQSIPGGQWEAAHSLAFKRRQVLFEIILPQCVKRMLPPWMNLYAILTMATVLASVVGVAEVMTQTQRVLSAENRPEFIIPFYAFVLFMFFVYCYPIARLTQWLEMKYAVEQ